MIKVFAFLISVATLAIPASGMAHDMSGIHAFVNDDRNQFVDLWRNDSGKLTAKVSNGRPWRPMWVVVHVSYRSEDNRELGRQDLHVYCPSPNPGGHGAERWFEFASSYIGSVHHIELSSNQEASRDVPEAPDPIMVPIYRQPPT
ncbi:hypothetical protein EHI44_29530 [Rhizobium leguminosarum]|uniref:hypothetical protein n=1 Tax=Rhizobium leguminosarum TaxID=384 RepID=UPI000FEDF2E6|nr:hypothetical protein [Rhizobium leguminosarum]RWY80467.1 hypothetical protein EHI44_29530 [Rhizobium leguminosarum]